MSCSHPILVNNHLCACGRCLSCRNKKVSDWATRCQLERLNYKDDCFFVTLTYNNENLPRGGVLEKSDLQKYFKNLRRQIEYYKLLFKIKYFACGEYGKRSTIRPHYHFIIYGLPFDYAWLIGKCWKKGFFKIDFAEYKTFRYVAKYSVKQFQSDKYGVSEFVILSKGFGFSYVNTEKFKDDLNNGFILIDNFKRSLPYSLKRKAKELNIFKDKKEITIIYNEKIYDSFADFVDNLNFNKIAFKKDFPSQYFDFSFKTFKEYFHGLENFIKKEKEKYFKDNFYNEFYNFKYKKKRRFFFKDNNYLSREDKYNYIDKFYYLNDFFDEKKTLSNDNVFGLFRDKIYSHFDFIFY